MLILRNSMREQETDRLAIMRPPASLRQRGADINSLDLVASFLLLLVRNGVGDDQAVEAAAVQILDGLAGQNAVDDDGVDFLGTMLHYRVGGLDQRAAGVGHIVDDDGNLVLHVANQDHARDLIRTRALLVDQGELQIEAVGNPGGPGDLC